MPKMGEWIILGPRSTLFNFFFLICSLGFSEIKADDRFYKMGKNDYLQFRKKIHIRLKLVFMG